MRAVIDLDKVLRRMLNQGIYEFESLADLMGVNPDTVRRIIRGTSCSFATAISLARALDVPPTEIVAEFLPQKQHMDLAKQSI